MIRITTALCCALLAAFSVFAQEPPARSPGQILYLPVYSHIWHGDVDRSGSPVKALVSVLVSVRNTDPTRPIWLVSAQ